MVRAVVRPLEKRGRPYLFSESKMIKARLFPQISFRQRRREFFFWFYFHVTFKEPFFLLSRLTNPKFSHFLVFDVDIVCDVQARQMKSVVKASRREAMHQEAIGIAPPQGDSTESSPEDFPKEEHDGDVPEYVRRKTQGPDDEPDLTGDVHDLGGPIVNKGAETIREPLGMMTPKISAPTKSIPIPSVGGGAELRHLDPNSDDPTVDLNARRRQSGKRRATFSPGRPAPKIPRVVAYVDSSSGDEGDTGVEQAMTRTPPRDQVRVNAKDSIDSPQATSTARLLGAGAGASGSGPSVQPDEPTPETMLKAMASGRAYIGEDSWSYFRVGPISSCLHNFFNSASYREMVSAGEFFKMKNRATDRDRANWDLSVKKHVDTSLESLQV
ncbi:hypothetical protein LWI29_036944 [Acer saccharum]|uniref:Uncharacterized protein n=1 Tax=Acer saccharum TaxID=4024 RepID=A0AA39RFZ9_ACESA|nr:hypothetical protein LWI29_036944 [Acer saccharum]